MSQLTIKTSTDLEKDYLEAVYVFSHSSNTVQSYQTALKRFRCFLKEVYGLEDYQLILKVKEKVLEVPEILKKFVQNLDKNDYKPVSITMWLGAVKGYLRHAGIKIYSEDLKGIVRIPKPVRVREIPVTKQLIVKLLHMCPLKLQTVILVAIASGMRIGEIVQLRLSDIDFSSKPTAIHIRAETTKTREARTTYLTSEATSCVEQYLARYFGWKKYEPNISIQDKMIFARTSLDNSNVKSPKPYRYHMNTLQQMLIQRIKNIPELDIKSENGRKVIHFHAFRKFFRTTVGNIVGRDFAEALIGHHFYMDTYYNTPEEKIKEMYLKAESALTISDFTKVDKTMEEMQQKIINLETELEKVKQQRKISVKYQKVLSSS